MTETQNKGGLKGIPAVSEQPIEFRGPGQAWWAGT